MRRFLLIAGIICILDGLFAISISDSNFGNIAPLFAGILSLTLYAGYNKLTQLTRSGRARKIKFFLLSLAAVGLTIFAALCFIIAFNSAKKAPVGANVIIVLGSGLRGDKVSLSLANRLITAHEYYKDNPGAIIAVSGGQGPNEAIPEAEAMKNYLMMLGVPENTIVTESKSTSTYENFLFTKAIVDELIGNDQYSAVYVTNDFHVYRAGLIAKRFFTNINGLSAPSPPYLIPNFYIRESAALVKYLLFVNGT